MNLDNPCKVASGFVSVLAGVWIYCLLISSIFFSRPYGEVAAEQAREIGIGFSVVIVLVGAAFTAYSAWRARKNLPEER
ncbi:MAG: hypothetical protein MR654_11300 [Corynebacterium glucuronolyticum]|nr:hypothetical protein [Corynebacterium glucuronolyticum]